MADESPREPLDIPDGDYKKVFAAAQAAQEVYHPPPNVAYLTTALNCARVQRDKFSDSWRKPQS